jgi:hypothetical protein
VALATVAASAENLKVLVIIRPTNSLRDDVVNGEIACRMRWHKVSAAQLTVHSSVSVEYYYSLLLPLVPIATISSAATVRIHSASIGSAAYITARSIGGQPRTVEAWSLGHYCHPVGITLSGLLPSDSLSSLLGNGSGEQSQLGSVATFGAVQPDACIWAASSRVRLWATHAYTAITVSGAEGISENVGGLSGSDRRVMSSRRLVSLAIALASSTAVGRRTQWTTASEGQA